ncbi:uncharacterized protein B0I36DRAFT_387111 [Microdochium trichocladiopsis]|uniref:SNF2 N-terminal domain-containing protein n=1 Tax=Microdochium trichocladiopsis TaxID=1682393 RepID=A0A9P9BL51_9PEZI|nr:uncharacterized protein B0I36DRAFT_387111 [Microdochium trichocladiopsis]KAH7024567.1 hypothetical protein B0I36DRAFT_387111 [Microdochium trichocladiopsis]
MRRGGSGSKTNASRSLQLTVNKDVAPISEANLLKIIHHANKKYRVEESDTAERIADELAITSHQTAAEALDTVDVVIRHNFRTSRLMNGLPSVDVKYEDCVSNLGIASEVEDEGKPRWDNLQFNKRGKLRVRAHQIRDATKIMKMLLSALRSCLLANDVGSGKTITSGLAIWAHWRHQHSLWEAAKDPAAGIPRVEFQPSLYFVPANLLTQTYEELRDKFAGLFDGRLLYGSLSTSMEDQVRKEATFSSDAWNKFTLEVVNKKDDPTLGR